MTYRIFFPGLSRSEQLAQSGMTLLETIVAMAMLVTFTSVVVIVMQFSHHFLVEASESSPDSSEPSPDSSYQGLPQENGCEDPQSGETIFTDGQPCEPNKGILIDQLEIQMAMDSLVEVLSQPGINVLNGQFPIAHPLPLDGSDPNADYCVSDPVVQWLLPMPEVSLPPGYRMCLWSTTEIEQPKESRPGIYLLQALPAKKSFSGLPARRLFCRPRPYC